VELAALKRRQFIEKWQVRVALATGLFTWLFILALLMYGIHLDYQRSKGIL
jgi:hypothetical protein